MGPLLDSVDGEVIRGADGQPRIAYLHENPYERQLWLRDSSEFFGTTEQGEPRFRRLKK